MGFGYFPDFAGKKPYADWYLKIWGYPYPARRLEAKEVINRIGVKEGERVLDIGCGDGVWTNQLAKSARVLVVGLDYSMKDLKRAKWRAEEMKCKNARYCTAEAGAMPFADNSFDKVFSISTFEHIHNDQVAFDEAARVLVPGGKLVVSVPNRKTLLVPKWLSGWPKSWKKWFRQPIREASSGLEYQDKVNQLFAHYRLYSPRLLKERASKAGLKPERVNFLLSSVSLLPQTLYHTWRIFDWNKSVDTQYKFASMAVFPLLFPLTYPFYLLDRWLNLDEGYILVAEMVKPKKVPDGPN